MIMRAFYTLDRSCQKLEALSSMAPVTRSRFQGIAAVLKAIYCSGFLWIVRVKEKLGMQLLLVPDCGALRRLDFFLRSFQEPLQADPSVSPLANNFLNESHRRSADLDELNCTKAFGKAIQ
jgi:hypothetical protein